jgi:hypothetical protein
LAICPGRERCFPQGKPRQDFIRRELRTDVDPKTGRLAIIS